MASNSAACNFFPLGLTLLFLVALVSSTSAQPAPAVLPRSGNVLQVLVPAKPEFKEFVGCSSNSSGPVKGFCIDVFKSALDILIPKPNWTDVNYTCFNIGYDTYDSIINALSNKSYPPYDAVVGDLTISASRLEMASFTQPYLDSGIVIVTPAKGVSRKIPGVFFVPFTLHTWLILIASMVLAGLALWLLECNGNPHLLITESKSDKCKRIFWFVTSILVFFKRESITNPLAKFVTVAWILFIIRLGSSYTASLSSILTVNELSSEYLSINDLSRMNLPVGYQLGSIVKDYLTVRHNMTNLVALSNSNEYADALRNKTVVAVVDEIPYIRSFLAAQPASNCRFAVSSKLTIEGLGFAFYEEALSAAFSVAILNLSESGQIQKLQDGWKLGNFECPSTVQSADLDLKSSAGLFIFLGGAAFVCILIFLRKRLPCGLPRMRRQANVWVPGSARRWLSARHALTTEDFV